MMQRARKFGICDTGLLCRERSFGIFERKDRLWILHLDYMKLAAAL